MASSFGSFFLIASRNHSQKLGVGPLRIGIRLLPFASHEGPVSEPLHALVILIRILPAREAVDIPPAVSRVRAADCVSEPPLFYLHVGPEVYDHDLYSSPPRSEAGVPG